MNKLMIIPALLAGFVIAAPAAMAFDDSTAFDISKHYAEQKIAAQGFNVQGVEEWSDFVVATVKDDQGRLSFKYFEPTYLKLVK